MPITAYRSQIHKFTVTLLILFIPALVTASCAVGDVPEPSSLLASGDGLGFTIYFIDVGQGDATLIESSSGERLLIDGGRSRSRIRDRLEALGVTDLDAIAMTHPDADHIAGLIEALNMYDVERVYLNGGDSSTATFASFMEAIALENAEVVTVKRGDVISLGVLELQVLHPGALTGNSNSDSMVLLLDCADVEVLFMADAEEDSEADMLLSGALRDIDVLRVGHHGSRTSSSQAFLDAVKPEVGVISAGLGNQYGHPHQEVVDRFQSAGTQIISTDTTDETDTIRMTSDCSPYEFEIARP